MSSPESSKALASQPSPVRPPSVSAAQSPVASQYVSTKRYDDQPDQPLQRTTPLEWIRSRIVTSTKTTIHWHLAPEAGPAMSTPRLNFSSRTERRARLLELRSCYFYLEPDPLMSGSEGFPPADAPACEKGLAPPTHSGASGAKNEASAMPTLSVSQETKPNNPKPPITDGFSKILSTAEDENESPDHPDPQVHPQEDQFLPGGASRDTNHPNQQRNILPGSPSIPPSAAAAAAAGAMASEVVEEPSPSRSSLGGLQTFSLRLSMHLEGGGGSSMTSGAMASAAAAAAAEGGIEGEPARMFLCWNEGEPGRMFLCRFG